MRLRKREATLSYFGTLTPRKNGMLKLILGSLGIFFTIMFSYIGLIVNNGYSVIEVIVLGTLASISIIAWRFLDYRPRQKFTRSVSLALFDYFAYLCLFGIILWGFVLPGVRPTWTTSVIKLFNTPSFSIGVYPLILVMGLGVLSRVLLIPFSRTTKVEAPGQIEAMLGSLNVNISTLGEKLDRTYAEVDPTAAEKVESIANDLLAVKRELAALRGTGMFSPGAGQPSSMIRAIPPHEPESPNIKRDIANISGKRSPSAREGGQGLGGSVPDSVVDNPWLSVLSMRRVAKEISGESS